MIPITPEILGPGIEEEYADALALIDKMLELLKNVVLSNDTPDGRAKHELTWLKQEILAQRLPAPVGQGWVATLGRSLAENDLYFIPGFQELNGQLLRVLRYGIVKARHYPVVISLIEDALAVVNPETLSPVGKHAVMDVETILERLRKGKTELPVPSRQEFLGLSSAQWTREPLDDATQQLMMNLRLILLDGYRPKECRKGPLAPPNPEPARRVIMPPGSK